VGIGLDIKPGGGALIFSPDYSFIYERYDRGEGSAGAGYSIADLDNMRHVPKLRASWKFLPKTAVFLEVEGHLARYISGPNVDANILLAQLGAAGSVTQRVALLLKAGYGNTLMSGDDNFSSFVGQLEFNYLFSETMRFRAGALRTVQPTTLFKYFDMIRGYIGYTQAFGGRLQLDLNLAYNYLDFGDAIAQTSGLSDRVDNNVTGDVTLSYQVLEWLTVSLTNRLDLRESSGDNPMHAPDSYFTNDFYLRASARY
jgi:hypothetical protein